MHPLTRAHFSIADRLATPDCYVPGALLLLWFGREARAFALFFN